eukprot:TRINITY_DN4027_c0_g1_i1.p1 TRINITY_DN4027_c0_g1~~TRINITY_DN4027_c0_g1_i1.p1  ORF type:complete len:184 (-),score=39.14 TRINITY_DN4027_c0_g1_i1:54-605(-)
MLKLVVVLCFVALASSLCFYPPTEDKVVASMYLGRWYQLAEDPFVEWTTEEGAVCATATYGLNPNGTVSVLNKARLNDPVNGTEYSIAGWAVQDSIHPGRLSVSLQGVPVVAPYWILKLGPVVNNQYSWAIVSDDFCVSLYVLSRTPALPSSTITEIQKFLSNVGFTMPDQFVPMLQQGCVYP